MAVGFLFNYMLKNATAAMPRIIPKNCFVESFSLNRRIDNISVIMIFPAEMIGNIMDAGTF